MSHMATDTADAPPARTRPDPTRRLWQVPVFLLGVAAFAAAYTGWLPIGPPDPAGAFRRDLAALRTAAERLAPDPAELKTQLSRVAGSAEAFPEHAAAAHFALGTGYVRLAETTPDVAEARDFWVLAKQHFDAVRADRLPDPADQPRFIYRSAKARAVDLPPNTPPAEIDLIRNLLSHTPSGEDPGDGPRLVAELSLRLVPPDLRKAKEALTAYVAEAGLATPPGSIARAKLRLSRVQLDLGDAEQAKKWLASIGPDAPPDVLAPAKAQLALIRMAEHDWAGAAREWEQVRKTPDLPPALRPTAAYHLGVCRTLGKPADPAGAARLFEEAAKGTGPEGAAGSVRLAEIRLRAPEPTKRREVVGLLATAVKGVKSPADYANGLVPLNEVQAVFEFAVQILLTDGAFEEAVAVAGSYRAVAPAGRDREKRAEALAAWAAAVQKGGGDAAAKFAAAADEYVALAELRPADSDKAEQYRRAATLYRQAGNTPRALAALEHVLKLGKLPDELVGPVWVEYAEGLLAANRPADALAAFKQAMASAGPASTIARHRLARLLIDSREPRKVPLGVALLEQIAQAERVAPTEQEAHERALVELAHEHIRTGNFAEAEGRLRTQLKLYPTGPEAGLGRFLLGVCLIQRADPKAKPPLPDPARALDEAMGLFKQLLAEVAAREKAGQPAERDPWLRTQARLRVLQTYQGMDKPWDVLKTAGDYRPEVAGTVDELIVLSLMYHAFKRLDKPENALAVRDQMRAAFDQLKAKPGAFWAKTGEYSLDYWEKVWFAPDQMK
jgi:tetratricopeptide (TPR) repeat protein